MKNSKMTIEDLGYNDTLESHRKDQNLEGFEAGRVIAEHKERYIVKTPDKEFNAELIGNLRFTGNSRYDFPAVGDWVAFSEYDEDRALIHAIYPRYTILERQAVSKAGQVQIIATNIDYGLIVQAVNRDFNINRLERYLTVCHAAHVKPLIVLSKVDLIDETELATMNQLVSERIKKVPIIPVSHQPKGYSKLEKIIEKGKTYCLLGSSGVGKSTILNHLAGKKIMQTSAISSSVNKGKHTTSHRELILLDNGGILIDNPGLREVGMTDVAEGLELTFDAIYQYAQDCKFKDCTHTQEKGCAVIMALEEGEITEASYANFRKMEKEKNHFESDALERRRKDKKFGKMVKNILKEKRKTKY